ncbi:MAG: hypothetical protein LBH87_03780 [Coriobacteriales bacterium]|jgi:hypothetical protein|nr:hypothetical protein [Coriobacteriales bacterium]
MKTCPYCQSVTFDDMDVCYGCLHHFEDAESTAAKSMETTGDLKEINDGLEEFLKSLEEDLEPIEPTGESGKSDSKQEALKCMNSGGTTSASVTNAGDSERDKEALHTPAQILPSRSPEPKRGATGGIARLQVRLPGGYHYDVLLEKPEGASLSIGWLTEEAMKEEAAALSAVHDAQEDASKDDSDAKPDSEKGAAWAVA